MATTWVATPLPHPTSTLRKGSSAAVSSISLPFIHLIPITTPTRRHFTAGTRTNRTTIAPSPATKGPFIQCTALLVTIPLTLRRLCMASLRHRTEARRRICHTVVALMMLILHKRMVVVVTTAATTMTGLSVKFLGRMGMAVVVVTVRTNTRQCPPPDIIRTMEII